MLTACNKDKKQYKSSSVRYFQTWSGINHPINPQDEFPIDSIKFKTTYYVAYYQDENLIRFKKLHNEVVLFEYFYKYDNDGNPTEVTIKKPSSDDKTILIK